MKVKSYNYNQQYIFQDRFQNIRDSKIKNFH